MLKKLGFTLIEVMVVLGILSILVALAYPSYENSVRKGRRADAQAKLREVEVFAARRFTVDSNYSCFADGGDCEPPAGDSYYTFSVAVGNPALTYTVTATPQGSQTDDHCGAMTLDQTGRVTAGGAGCWHGQSS